MNAGEFVRLRSLRVVAQFDRSGARLVRVSSAFRRYVSESAGTDLAAGRI